MKTSEKLENLYLVILTKYCTEYIIAYVISDRNSKGHVYVNTMSCKT